jgi:hypothetical protein
MMSVFMLSLLLSVSYKPFTLSVAILNVVMLSVIMLSVIMLSVIILSAIMLNVVAPLCLLVLLILGNQLILNFKNSN